MVTSTINESIPGCERDAGRRFVISSAAHSLYLDARRRGLLQARSYLAFGLVAGERAVPLRTVGVIEAILPSITGDLIVVALHREPAGAGACCLLAQFYPNRLSTKTDMPDLRIQHAQRGQVSPDLVPDW